MEGKNPISVTIVDRNYPPNKSVIAESASDLAKSFIDQGYDVKVVHTDGDYPGGGAEGKSYGTTYKVKSFYNGKIKLIRLASNLLEGHQLIKKAIKVSKGPIIIMTNPPLLSYWAAKRFKKKNIPWVYWTMDLYPEAFLANGLVKKSNIIYKHFLNTLYRAAPTGLISLGPIQSKYLQEKFKKKIPTVILPCGVLVNNKKKTAQEIKKPDWKKNENKIHLGYIGNLGEAHSVGFLKDIIDNINPEKHQLNLVVYGSKAHIIKDYIKDKTEGILLLDYLPRNELSFIDIHLVSLTPEWVNLCVPSKLVSAVHNKSLFLFHGIRNCDSWDSFQKAGWIIAANENPKQQTKDFLQFISKEEIENKKKQGAHLPEQLEKQIEKAHFDIIQMIKSIS